MSPGRPHEHAMQNDDRREPFVGSPYGEEPFVAQRRLELDEADGRSEDERPPTPLRPSSAFPSSAYAKVAHDEDVQEGAILARRYRVQQCLGRTGHEIVLIARHLELGQRVLVRYLSPLAMELPEVVMSFQRTARKAFELRSEHAERVLDFGRLESGSPYRVSELPRGPSADEILKVRGPLPLEEAVDLVIMASEAVAEAHAARLIYKAFGTWNLFVERRSDGSPLVKVVDFSVLDALSGDILGGYELAIPGAGSMTQSLRYIAPEQIRNPGGVDYRANIWGLGGILHELLVGRPAFEADTSVALLAMIVADTPAPLNALRPDVPAEIAELVRSCLSKDPAKRPQTVGAVVDALAPFASTEIRAAAARIGRVVPGSSPPPSSFRPPDASFAPPALAPGFSSSEADRYFVRPSQPAPSGGATAVSGGSPSVGATQPAGSPAMELAQPALSVPSRAVSPTAASSYPAEAQPLASQFPGWQPAASQAPIAWPMPQFSTPPAAASALPPPATGSRVGLMAVGGLIGVLAATVVVLALRGPQDMSASSEAQRTPLNAAAALGARPGEQTAPNEQPPSSEQAAQVPSPSSNSVVGSPLAAASPLGAPERAGEGRLHQDQPVRGAQQPAPPRPPMPSGRAWSAKPSQSLNSSKPAQSTQSAAATREARADAEEAPAAKPSKPQDLFGGVD
jgi:eukaryotic-like serine/threonine-protein kinase